MGNQQFDYDELNRPTLASGNYGDIDYIYDGVGNRQTRTIDKDSQRTEETYAYEPGSHRLDRVTTTDNTGTDTRQFAHDGNGNIVEDRNGEHALEMLVNARNRLEAMVKNAENVGEYEYNALGQRIAKTSRYRGRLHAHFDQGNKTVTPTGARKHSDVIPTRGRNATGVEGSHAGSNPSTSNLHSHYDNKPVTERLHFHYDQSGNLIAESDRHGNVVREYIYLGNYRIAMMAAGLDKPTVTPNARQGKNVVLSASEESRSRNKPLVLYYIHNDHLGTPRKVTDTDQRIVWSTEQTPFGEVTLTTAGIRMPMRFPGQYADIETGFSYNYFRDYDPTLGRYIQKDPLNLRDGPLPYGYAHQAPSTTVDFRGTFGLFGGAVGAVVGAVSAYNAAVRAGEHNKAVPLAVLGGVAGFGLGFAAGPAGVAEAGATGTGVAGIVNLSLSVSLTGTADPVQQVEATLTGFLTALLGNTASFRSALLLIRHGSTKTTALEFGSATGTAVAGTSNALLEYAKTLARALAHSITQRECEDE